MAAERQSALNRLHRMGGYLPIEDYGLVGDGATAALIGRDGSVAWLCLPRFDSPPLFCGLLDVRRGGHFTITPNQVLESRQFYEPDTALLVTEMRSPTGLLRVTDFCPLVAGADLSEDVSATRRELLRTATVVEGRIDLTVHLEPHGGAEAEPRDGGIRIRCQAQPDLNLHLYSTVPLTGLRTSVTIKAGQSLHLLLCWRQGSAHSSRFDQEAARKETVAVWRKWLQCLEYHGPQAALIRRSAITIKLLDHFENGAIVAAPTSSLPELIGGGRNWDYRYAWVRMRHSRSTRCIASASRTRPPVFSPGYWMQWNAMENPASCMTSTDGGLRRSNSMPGWKDTAVRNPCAGACGGGATTARCVRRDSGLCLSMGGASR